MVRETIRELVGKLNIKPGSRDEMLDQLIAGMQRLIKDIKKSATTLDLHRIDWLYHGMQELRLAKTLTRDELQDRINTLTHIEKYEKDPDEQVLASASLETISIASKRIRSKT